MRLEQHRGALVVYGRRLLQSGLTRGTGGNLSIFDRASGTIAMTPSGVDYLETVSEDIVLMDLAGRIVECREGRRPTSEWELHLAIYRRRPDLSAIVHTHSVYATAIACTGQTIRPVHYLAAIGGTAIRCAPYATYGTPELANTCAQTLGEDYAILMANHGVICAAGNLPEAFSRAEHIEFVAQLQCISDSLGGARVLDEAAMSSVREKFGTNPYR